MSSSESLFQQTEAMRSFNRFYTQHIGVLNEGLLASPFSLTEARVLFELGTRASSTASEIAQLLGLDAGHLSRLLQGFITQGLVTREVSQNDGGEWVLLLTQAGHNAFRKLDQASHTLVAAKLAQLSKPGRDRLLASLEDVRQLLSLTATGDKVIVRTHRIGDIGWAIERHGRLYAEEFGWNEEFEALVATLFAQFATRHDPTAERMWVAEVDGERVGCVFVVRNAEDSSAAQLRCLLVDPKARGLGVGKRLVDECIAFAEGAGYAKIMLWTNDNLVAARRIYQAAGFALVSQESHHSFGHDLIGQVWLRPLSACADARPS